MNRRRGSGEWIVAANEGFRTAITWGIRAWIVVGWIVIVPGAIYLWCVK